MKDRLKNIEEILSNNTVLNDWFSPLINSLERVRYSDKIFSTLSMETFILQNCVRQLNNCATQREHLQSLFHLDDEATLFPLARSTYSDALSSKIRLHIASEAAFNLAEAASVALPDRLSGFKELDGRPVYAMDGTYQNESCHFNKVTPSKVDPKNETPG